MRIGFNHKNKKFSLDVERCGIFGMFRGLMFRRRETAPALLLFDFKKSHKAKIHSFFVFFPFVAVWLDNKNRIVEFRIIPPWKFCVFPQKKFSRLVEIPINRKYRNVVCDLDFDGSLVGDAKDLNR